MIKKHLIFLTLKKIPRITFWQQTFDILKCVFMCFFVFMFVLVCVYMFVGRKPFGLWVHEPQPPVEWQQCQVTCQQSAGVKNVFGQKTLDDILSWEGVRKIWNILKPFCKEEKLSRFSVENSWKLWLWSRGFFLFKTVKYSFLFRM